MYMYTRIQIIPTQWLNLSKAYKKQSHIWRVVNSMIIRQIKSRRMRWAGMWHARERKENCTRFRWESPKERDHSEDDGVGGRIGSEWILGRLAWAVWIGFDWLRIGTGGGLL
jgi:hypothetical protein